MTPKNELFWCNAPLCPLRDGTSLVLRGKNQVYSAGKARPPPRYTGMERVDKGWDFNDVHVSFFLQEKFCDLKRFEGGMSV